MPIKPSFFQGKNIQTQGLFKQRKDMTIHEEVTLEKRQKFKLWITFYRRNLVRFIETYFEIKLHPYQKIMIWLLQRSNLAYIVASRASAKTWVVAVYSLAMATLYPGIKLKICAKTMKQASEILKDKLQSLRDTHPMINRELDTIICNANGNEANFFNGSMITVVPSSDSARGGRCSILLVEESRLVPRDTIEKIMIPMLETRNPPYRQLPQYTDEPLLQEEGRIIYISSAGYKSESWFEYVKTTIKRMLSGDETANFMALDYLICLKHGIKTKQMLKNEMQDLDDVTKQLEYLNIPSGQSGKSFYRISLFPRKMKRAYYPQYMENYNPKRNPYDVPKSDGEIRLLSLDIAARANKTNDITSIWVSRLIPLIGKGYNRQLIYGESHKGANGLFQAKRTKQIFHDLGCDYIAMDVLNMGAFLYDILTQLTPDEERGIEYDPMTIVEDFELDIPEKAKEDLTKRTYGVNAKPVIFPITGSQELNSQIAIAFKDTLKRKLWDFLTPDAEAEEFLLKNYKDLLTDEEGELKAFLLNPYVQTNLLIGECLNLNMEMINGRVKLSETPGSHKDRFSSVSYLNYIVYKYFDPTIKKVEDNNDTDWDVLQQMTSFL
jgi:hypothetical protein